MGTLDGRAGPSRRGKGAVLLSVSYTPDIELGRAVTVRPAAAWPPATAPV